MEKGEREQEDGEGGLGRRGDERPKERMNASRED